jgi:ribonucleoside-diphosphate reductase alpha chain
MLDDVLDITHWPLEEQRAEAMQKRRIGLGFTGLGDTLIMLGIKYDTDAGYAMARHIAATMRDAAYRSSIMLAQERGAFPLFDRDKYLKSEFVKRLPEDIREEIKIHGIRNSHLLSIAPTGTISLAFGNNVSGGIEPAFSWHYQRNVRNPDGSKRTVQVYDYAHLVYQKLGGDTENLPESFISAMEISALDHMRMVKTIAPYIDSAISKTVNVPEDYPFEDFKDLYLEAYKGGLKGITTYRPSPERGAVLELLKDESDSEQPDDIDDTDPDRRIHLESIPTLPLDSLRFPRRPYMPNGNPSWTYTVKHPHGAKFALFVGHLSNGKDYPFEVWVNGVEQPRGLGALAIILSHDMFSRDRGWLRKKLESLGKCTAEGEGFELPMPPDGDMQYTPSLVSAMAKLIQYRCNELDAFRDLGETPVLDALMSPKEPKSGADGTMSWTVDVLNANTGDDFVLGLKELTLPNGQRRPYSMWLSGNYPRALDGLCKALSLDMRVIDPAWIGKKLRELLNYSEPQGDFMAWIPGLRKQQMWPSTIAYIARLLIHRYAMLGILDEDGQPVDHMGIMESEDDAIVTLRSVGAMATKPAKGKLCTNCGAYTVIRYNGCDMCTACGEQGSCG